MKLKTAGITKRSYHPLVVFSYYANRLEPEHLAQIPKTTIDYWRKNDHTTMHGYEWISTFYAQCEDFNKIQKHKIIFKSVRLCCKLFDTFSVLCKNIKTYKTLIKNNAAAIISTIDYLTQEIPLRKACRVFNITTQKYYHLKNKLYCSASVLNHCFKTHPQQLTVSESSIINKAVNDPDNDRNSKLSIMFKLRRAGKLFCAKSTFNKYVSLLSEKPVKKKIKKPALRLKATRIFEYIHVDTTFLPTFNDGKVRAVIIKDNTNVLTFYYKVL